MGNTEIDRVRDALKTYPKGITIAEMSKQLALNRISTSKYLNMLLAYGQAEMRILGPSKVFYPCQRIPLSTILNFSTSHLLVMDDNLTIIDANNALLGFFALEKRDLVGQRVDFSPIAGYFDPSITPQLKRALGFHESTLETRITLQGKEHVLKIKCIPTVFESGDNGVSLLTEDITELTEYREHLEELVDERSKELQKTNDHLKKEINNHKKARNELRISEIKYRELVENANSIIVKTDKEGKIVYFNEFAQHFFGYTESEVLGKSIYDTIVPAIDPSGKNIREIRQEIRNNPEKYERYEHDNIKKNGERVWISWTNKLIHNDEGIITGLLSIGNDITERKRVEDALAESEERFRLAMEASSDGIWDADVTTGTGYLSPNYYRMLGYEPGEFTPVFQEWITLIHPDDKERVLSINQDCIENRCQSFEAEYRMKAKDGSWKWVLTRAKAVSRDAGGRALRIIGTHVDINARKLAEEALHESENLFREVFNNANDAIFLHEISLEGPGKYLLVNDQATQWLGYTKEEFMQMSPGDIVPEKIFEKIQSRNTKTLLNDKPITFESVHRRKDGSTYPVEVSTHKFQIKGTDVVLAIARDITERKKAEELLHESEEKFRSFVENANEIVFSLTSEGILTYVSPKCTELLGYDPGDVIGKSAIAFVYPDDVPHNREVFRQTILTGEKKSGIELRIQHKNGTWRWYSQSLSLVHDAGGRVVAIQGICHDITERKRTVDALRNANRQLNLLTSITRHDILNKISVVLGYLKIAEMKSGDPTQVEYLKKVESATAAIRSQIEFTRVYRDLGTHEPQWIALDTVVPRSQVPSTITLNANVQGITVFADPMLEKVFTNLLDNSTRHGEHVTKIRVSSQKEGDDLIVVWEDNGIGVAADEKERIFERGFGKNTGFGLFLVREILSLTELTIKETGEPGKGARFEITAQNGMYRFSGVQ